MSISTASLNRKLRIKSIIAASSGNLVEWYDFYIYAFSANYFAHHFSRAASPTVALIATFGVFALGFFMRPLGSYIFGAMADKVGRRKSMIYSVVLMAFGSFMIAALPTQASVGDSAILLLLAARIIQGISVGGEYGIAATYLSEMASPHRRSFYSSFQYVTLMGGQLLAVLSLVILEQIFDTQALKEWAWRLLFVFGGILALGSLFIRGEMQESVRIHKKDTLAKERGTLRGLWKYKRSVWMVLGFTACGSLYFYTFTTYIKTFMVNTSGIAEKSANRLMLLVLFIAMLAQPLFGLFADQIGRRRALILFALLGLIFTYPLLSVLSRTQNLWAIFGLVMLSICILSLYTSVAGIVKAELFPMHVRALGTGLSYAVANALFGGTAPYVALQCKRAGVENYFFIYILIMLCLCLFVAYKLPKKTTLS